MEPTLITKPTYTNWSLKSKASLSLSLMAKWARSPLTFYAKCYPNPFPHVMTFTNWNKISKCILYYVVASTLPLSPSKISPILRVPERLRPPKTLMLVDTLKKSAIKWKDLPSMRIKMQNKIFLKSFTRNAISCIISLTLWIRWKI